MPKYPTSTRESCSGAEGPPHCTANKHWRVSASPGIASIPRLLFTLLSICGLLVGSTLALAAASARDTTDASLLLNLTLSSQADAMVAAGTPTTNYGAGNLAVLPKSQSYIYFDLSAIPLQGTVESATLQLMATDIGGQGSNPIDVTRAMERWNETTVTWETKPAVGANAATTSVETLAWHEWDVTPLVQKWHDGSFDNFGFALTTAAAGAYFDSKETLPAPQLVVIISLSETGDPDKPVPGDNPFSDQGDAPDSTNNHGIPNTAYTTPPTLGQFPTVYQGTAQGQPAGPRHANVTVEAFLGDTMTREQRADGGADDDGINNILRNPPAGSGSVADVADNDRGDDGWRNRTTPLYDCQRTDLVVRVHRSPGGQLEQMYLNVWFDGNRDGDWQDTAICSFDDGQPVRAYEWIVQNQIVDLTAIPPGSSRNIVVTTLLVHNPQPQADHWMRFMLSEQRPPISLATGLADGRGFHPSATPSVFAFGETEDGLYRPDPVGESGTLTLDKSVQVSESPVAYGGIATFTIRLTNQGGTQPVRATLHDSIGYPQQLVGDVRVTAIGSGASPLTAQIRHRVDRSGQNPRAQTGIQWRGTLAPDGGVELSFDVRQQPFCQPDQTSATIHNTATLHRADGTKIDEKSVAFQAACADVSWRDVQVSQRLIVDEPGRTRGVAQEDNVASQPSQHEKGKVIWTYFDQDAKDSVNGTVVFKFEVESSKPMSMTRASSIATEPVCTQFTLERGKTKALAFPLELEALVAQFAAQPVEASQELLVRSVLRYVFTPTHDPFDCHAIGFLDEDQIGSHEFQFAVRAWDLGDAPDSTNHSAAAMTAYTDAQAHFPTVFDVTTGAPEGPAHTRPRGFHLGRRVEIEPDADLGSGQRNIQPATDKADQDGFDDGTDFSAWSLEDCQMTFIPVRVAVSEAVAVWFKQQGSTAYLNAWIDSNRDGDWADTALCQPEDGPPKTVLEHFIIDHPVDAGGLGAGVHLLNVPTGLVPPQLGLGKQPMWVRLTLSERPSNKTLSAPNGISHGDGRGYPTPFLIGETEDTFWYPEGTNLGVELSAYWYPFPLEPALRRAAADMASQSYLVAIRVRFHNSGSTTAEDVVLKTVLPSALNPADLHDVSVHRESQYNDAILLSAPLIDDFKQNPGQLAIGSLHPGEGGTLVASWKVDASTILALAADRQSDSLNLGHISAELVSSSQDISPSDNTATAAVEVPRPNPQFGFVTPDGRTVVRQATTSRGEVQIRGRAYPHSRVRLRVVGRDFGGEELGDWVPIEEEIGVDAHGVWSYLLQNLPDGRFLVGAVYADNSSAKSLDRVTQNPEILPGTGSAQSRLDVDKTLAFNPHSLVFIDAQGNRRGQGGLLDGLLRGMAFQSDQTYQICLQATDSTNPPTDIVFSLRLDGQVEGLVVPLAQNERANPVCNDGTPGVYYAGSFTIPPQLRSAAASGDASLTLFTQKGEAVYEGSFTTLASAVVTDLNSGQPITGASVSLLMQTAFSGTVSSSARYDLWDRVGSSQPNPQPTDGNGSYFFVPAEGTYRVWVEKEGYQPYRSRAVALSAGDAFNEPVALTPAVTAKPDLIVEIDAGGFTPALKRLPPDTTIRWINLDVTEHTVTSAPPSRAGGNQFDSGSLMPGESYTYTVREEGTIGYSDAADPFNSGTLIVDTSAPPLGQRLLHLPTVMR
ncbi:MAG: DNRLRE domain-containing protein [Caldilineaceae bacterium]